MNQQFLNLKNLPLENYFKKIKGVRRGNLASEYNDFIFDYSKEPVSITKRLIKPYITSENHGENVFDGLISLIDNLKVKTILDLGCGAGEFLSKVSNKIEGLEAYGITIHVGEVRYARDNFKLSNVVPMDMREINQYFNNDYFDCIVAHCCLHFIEPDERLDLLDKVNKLLKIKGYFIIIDYKFNKETGLSSYNPFLFKEINFKNYNTMGNLMVLQK